MPLPLALTCRCARVQAIVFLIIAITPETLPDSARRPFVWSSLNPFAFVQLLTARGAYRTSTDRPRIRALAAAKTLQMLPVFGVYDCEELFFRGELGMDAQAVGRFRSVRLTSPSESSALQKNVCVVVASDLGVSGRSWMGSWR